MNTYVQTEDTREIVDIVELNKAIEEIVAKQNMLRTSISSIVKDLEENRK